MYKVTLKYSCCRIDCVARSEQFNSLPVINGTNRQY